MRQKPDDRCGQADLGEGKADHPAQDMVLYRLKRDMKLVLDHSEVGPGGNFFAQGLIQPIGQRTYVAIMPSGCVHARKGNQSIWNRNQSLDDG